MFARKRTKDSDEFAVTTAKKIQVPVAELTVGMYVCELDRPWLESPFWFQGFPLRAPEDIEEVRQVCRYVYVDAKRSTHPSHKQLERLRSIDATTDKLRIVKHASDETRPVARLRRPIWRRADKPAIAGETIRSVRLAQHAFDDTARFVRHALSEVGAARSIDVRTARETVRGCVDHITRDPSAMLLLSGIRSKDEYTAEHSLSVGLLAIILGHQLRLSRQELADLGACGVLHDVGKVRSPDEILKKPERLTNKEQRVMRCHPKHGREMLADGSGVFREAIEVAYGHHERLDGSGYPRGLTEERLSLFTRMVAIVDTYDAITSDRVYAPGRTHLEAINILKAESGNHYDGELVKKFVEAMGIYPVGSTVQLSDGTFGVVVKANPKSPLRPLVLALRDADAQPLDPRYVDISKPIRGAHSRLYVARMLRPQEDCGIDKAVFRNQEFLRAIS